MHHHTSLLALLCCTLCGVTACKQSSTPTKPDATIKESAAAGEQPGPPAFMDALPLEEQRTIMIAAGCEDDDMLTASACTFCPAPAETSAAPLSEVTFLPGEFGEARGAVVLVTGCGARDGIASSSLVAVREDAQGQWGRLGEIEVRGVVDCHEGPGREGSSHTICQSELVRYGTRSRYYELFDWSVVVSGEEKEPFRSTLLELAEHDSCELNMGIEHIVTGPTYQDSDGDGVSEIVLAISTTTGPFTGTLDACPEEGFDGKLKPERASRTVATKYIYEQINMAVKERQDLPIYHSVGKEFEDLMEP